MKKLKSREAHLKGFIVTTLRRASYRWYARTEAMKAARTGRNEYKCNMCTMTFPRKEIQLDHIDPVIDPKVGWVSWDSYIDRMFCDTKGYQVVCKTCHSIKTDSERELKKKTRGFKKKKSV